jgi:molybdopterin-containing oxidoreductase family membrane subunit
MVLTLLIPVRHFYGLKDFITVRHLNNMAKVMLLTGLIVAYGYSIEGFTGWYSGSEYEKYMLLNRFIGPYKYCYYALLACNVLIPQLLWFRRLRRSVPLLFLMSLIVNTGMWLERFIIIVVSLSADFLPSSWGMYYPASFDWSMFLGTIGLFFAFLFIFIRILPMISVFEMRVLVTEEDHKKKGANHG